MVLKPVFAPFTRVLGSVALLLATALLVHAGETAAPAAPILSEAAIEATRSLRQAPHGPATEPAAIFQGVDMMNLLIVAESDGRQLTIVDGARLEPIHRFAAPHPLHDMPQFTPDGRYLFFVSRDGWITKFDIWTLQTVAEVRTGMEARNLAISSDGKYLAVANAQPHTLVLLDADLHPLKVHLALNKNRTQSSPLLAVHDAAARQSFVAVLEHVPEVWELSYDPKADDVPIGAIHDFLYKEGAFISGFLNPRRSYLAEPIADYAFAPGQDELVAKGSISGQSHVLHLDVRKKIASLQLPDGLHLACSVSWQYQPRPDAPKRAVMAMPNRDDGLIRLIDLENWATLKTVAAPNPGRCLYSHEKAAHVWAAATMPAQAGETLRVFDKRTLEVVADIRPTPGKGLAHIGFTRDGKHALVSLSRPKADGGALVVFDAATLKEVKRIPMDEPAGTYRPHGESSSPY